MSEYKVGFEMKDKVLSDLRCVSGAFSLLYAVDPERLNEDDLAHFASGMSWIVEDIYNNIADSFVPKEERKKSEHSKSYKYDPCID